MAAERDRLALVLGLVTPAESGPDSLYNQDLVMLGRVERFGFDGDRLVLYLADGTDRMVFVPYGETN